VKARNVAGEEGFVPENYLRVWNPVDDVGDSDTNEVNVDDDIPLGQHGLMDLDNYASYSDSKLFLLTSTSLSISVADHLVLFVCLYLHTD